MASNVFDDVYNKFVEDLQAERSKSEQNWNKAGVCLETLQEFLRRLQEAIAAVPAEPAAVVDAPATADSAPSAPPAAPTV
jgi:hypothetical protein